MPSFSDCAVRSRCLARFYRAVGLLGAAMVVLGILSVTQVMAQQTNPEPYTRDQLESFAAASLRVEALNAKWIPRLSDAGTAAENTEIRSQAMEEMTEAVRDEGLTVREYNEIYDAAQSDPRIMQVVEEFRQDMQR